MEQASESRRRLWIIVAAVCVVALIAGIAIWSTRRPAATSGEAQGSASGIPTSTVKPPVDPAIAAADVATQTPDGRWVTVPKDGGSPRDLSATYVLRVFWWNDTKARPARSFTVKWGSNGSWTGNGAKPSQTTTLGPFPVDVRLEVGLFPDGTGGDGWSVPLYISSKMLSDSDVDAVHMEIKDGGVKVLGNPVENFEVDYPRP